MESESIKIWIGRWIGLVVKCALTFAVAGVFISLLNLMRLWYVIHPVPGRVRDESPVAAGVRQLEYLKPDDGVYWPQFPGSSESSFQQVSINGVQMTSQSWKTTVLAKDVIAFYREQMTVRGWEDVTEENFKLKPDLRDPGISKNSLQDENYLNVYAETIDSNLVLRRGQWSIQVTTAPNEAGKLAQTTVRICATATPSLNDFVANLTSDFAAGSDAVAGGKPLEMEQKNAGQLYHTSIVLKNEEPSRVFNQMLKDYQAKSWHCLTFPSAQAGQQGYFASLVKGQSYGFLSVKTSPKGNGSSVTFTEVSQE